MHARNGAQAGIRGGEAATSTRNQWWLDADHTAMFTDAQLPSETCAAALPLCSPAGWGPAPEPIQAAWGAG